MRARATVEAVMLIHQPVEQSCAREHPRGAVSPLITTVAFHVSACCAAAPCPRCLPITSRLPDLATVPDRRIYVRTRWNFS